MSVSKDFSVTRKDLIWISKDPLFTEGMFCGVSNDLTVTRMHVYGDNKDLSVTRRHAFLLPQEWREMFFDIFVSRGTSEKIGIVFYVFKDVIRISTSILCWKAEKCIGVLTFHE
jgi:hypothetical protein